MKKPFPKHKMNIVSYALQTEDSFTWCVHKRYTMIMENENELYMIVFILEFNLKIVHKGNKYCKHEHTLTHTHAHKYHSSMKTFTNLSRLK